MKAIRGNSEPFALALSILLCPALSCGSVQERSAARGGRVYETSFENLDDFAGFYLVPQDEYASRHELSGENVAEGRLAHKAWNTGPRAATGGGLTYLPRRAYPAIQRHITERGSFVTPCLITFKAGLSMTLLDRPAGSIDDWFSFATSRPDRGDRQQGPSWSTSGPTDSRASCTCRSRANGHIFSKTGPCGTPMTDGSR